MAQLPRRSNGLVSTVIDTRKPPEAQGVAGSTYWYCTNSTSTRTCQEPARGFSPRVIFAESEYEQVVPSEREHVGDRARLDASSLFFLQVEYYYYHTTTLPTYCVHSRYRLPKPRTVGLHGTDNDDSRRGIPDVPLPLLLLLLLFAVTCRACTRLFHTPHITRPRPHPRQRLYSYKVPRCSGADLLKC